MQILRDVVAVQFHHPSSCYARLLRFNNGNYSGTGKSKTERKKGLANIYLLHFIPAATQSEEKRNRFPLPPSGVASSGGWRTTIFSHWTGKERLINLTTTTRTAIVGRKEMQTNARVEEVITVIDQIGVGGLELKEGRSKTVESNSRWKVTGWVIEISETVPRDLQTRNWRSIHILGNGYHECSRFNL